MSIITLLTDFGIEDAYVGTIKGVILSVNPSAMIVDITHQIDPQDLIEAAYVIKSTYRYFPKGTVHVIVVDPGVGSDRAIVALEMMGHIFLAPDNGVLTLLMDEGRIDSITRVKNSHYFLEPLSQTFHGRDIFAPVGAHISKGVDLKKLGSGLDRNDLVHLSIRKPSITDEGELVGTIVSVDRFGNCITNIDLNCLEKFYKPGFEKNLVIAIGECEIKGLSKNYDGVGLKQPLAIIGSLGYLEIALNCGRASRHFGAQKGDPIRVILSDKFVDGRLR
jgi:S-adenosylmethionine hydrolase